MVFCYGRDGITAEMLKLLQRLILRHNILTEEVEGEKMSVISLHNLVHLPDDIKRFSSPDNFWCYTFKRAVHTYVEQSSNKKWENFLLMLKQEESYWSFFTTMQFLLCVNITSIQSSVCIKYVCATVHITIARYIYIYSHKCMLFIYVHIVYLYICMKW